MNFFRPVQDKLRHQRMRHTYGLGYTLSTTGDDPNNTFNQFLVAMVVEASSRLHINDPKVRKAVIDTLKPLTDPFKAGYVPPSALNWGDPDNNNAFHARVVVMSPNGTISISVAVMTCPLPMDNAGKEVSALLGVELAFIPKGAKNVDAAKDFLRYLIQPVHLGSYLKEAKGRLLPVMPSIVHNDPYCWIRTIRTVRLP